MLRKEFVQNSSKIILNLNVRLLQNKRRSNSPKKDAILTAVDIAQFEYLLTTDADCIVPEAWLQAFNELIAEEHPKLIAGPVRLKTKP